MRCGTAVQKYRPGDPSWRGGANAATMGTPEGRDERGAAPSRAANGFSLNRWKWREDRVHSHLR